MPWLCRRPDGCQRRQRGAGGAARRVPGWHERPAMGRQRLYAGLRGAVADGRGARRPGRRAAGLHGRVCAVHARIAGMRPCPRPGPVERGQVRAGDRGRAPGPEFALVAASGLSRPRGTQSGGGVVGCRRWNRACRGAGRRRAPDRRRGLARHLPRQSADRRARSLADRAPCAGLAETPPSRARPRRPDRRRPCAVGADDGADGGERPWLDRPGRRRGPCRGRAARGAVPPA